MGTSSSSTGTTPTVGAPVVTPNIITAGTSTAVTITVQITDPRLIAGSVNLLQVGATGTQPITLGTMQGIGKNLYSLQTVFSQASPGQIQLEASAAFSGLLKRVISPPLQIPVWNAQATEMGLTVSYPPLWQITSLSGGAMSQSANGVEIYDPTDTSLDQSGIAITIDHNVSVTSDAATLHIGTLIQTYTETLGDHSWSIYIYDDSVTQMQIVIGLAQEGANVIRVGTDYSADSLTTFDSVLSLLQ